MQPPGKGAILPVPGMVPKEELALAAWVNAAGIFDASKLPDPFPPVLDADGKSLTPDALLPDIIAALNTVGIRATVTPAGVIELVY